MSLTRHSTRINSFGREGRSLLASLSHFPFNHSPLNQIQMQVDGLVTHFVHEAANAMTLVSLVAGGMAYRMGRIGVLGMGPGGSLVRGPLSLVVGLGSEVTAFEFTNRLLHSVPLTPALSLEGEGVGRNASLFTPLVLLRPRWMA